ncbi:alpha-glucosidase II [Planoprotostelium fungivorum]|uniref:Glucosidase II subunit alpha n=1 Tax=Planoprotostelium fungivorum TaxID=1890364 RepID=A0A2P6N3B0_9EUKA|nr:alpha-glucosidase II [Planoprotostelium fungivorum]
MRITSLLLCVLLAILSIEAVDRGKYKTCSQSSFCTRNRGVTHDGYHIANLHRKSDSQFTADFVSPYLQGRSLTFELTGLLDNTVRVRVVESLPKRYQGPLEVLEPLQEAKLSEKQKSSESTEFTLNSHVTVRIDFYYDGRHTLSANANDFLNFEHLRSKEEDDKIVPSQIPNDEATQPEDYNEAESGPWQRPTKENPKKSGRWEEHFGGHQDTKPNGPTSISMDITFIGSRYVYGIPEHASSLALTPTIRVGDANEREQVTDPYRHYNLDVFEYELNNPMALYGAVPFMIGHGAHGSSAVFWLNSAETWIDVETTTKDASGREKVGTQWISESGNMDIFFIIGPSGHDVLRQYAALTGTTALPPQFTLGYHQCKWNYKDETDVANVDSGFDSHDIPYDVIWLDIEHTDSKKYFTWDQNYFPTPKNMQEKIGDKGRRMVTIVDPHIKREGGYHVHSQAESNNYYVKNKDKNDYDGHCWPGSSSWVDYLKENARDWWEQLFSYYNYQGSTPRLYTWNDMNEPSVFNGPETTMNKDALHLDGVVEHRDVHNLYGMTMVNATARGLIRRHADQNERPFVLSRAFFAGIQKHGAIWTGDNTAGWDHLAVAQPMLLSLGLAGVAFSGADVGGFFGNPDAELVTRWYQAAAFQPFFRGHAHLDSKRREPWLFGEPYTSVIRDAIKSRYQHLPLWYTLFYKNTLTGLPPMRPLFLEFPSEEKIWNNQDQFLVGRELMVVPVTRSQQTTSRVVFPGAQKWYDITDGSSHAGGTEEEVNVPLEKYLVYQQGGTVVPKRERARRTSQHMDTDPFTLQIAVSREGTAEGELYVDDGHTFDFKKGVYSYNQIKLENGNLTYKTLGGVYESQLLIEKIVVYGLSSAPSSVTTVSNEKLDFSYRNGKLVIRKPNLPATREWSLQIKA